MSEEVINLPSRFKQLEYLESEISTSGAYAIDTGIKPNQNTGFWIDYNEVSDNVSNYQQAIFGARHTSRDKEFQLTHHENGILRFNNTSYPANFNLGTRYQVSLRNRIFTHYDGTQTVLPNTEWQCDYNIHLFCLNNAGTLFQGGATKVYRFKLYDGDTLVRDFIPVYDTILYEPCMYDLVTQTPFYNKSNEELLYPKIEEVINLPYGYKQCLFLESTGTQYINTNYVATNNTGAYVKWSLTNIKNYSNVLSSLGISTDDTADSVFMLPHWNGVNNAYLAGFMSRSENVLRLENQTAPTLYSVHESRLNYYNDGEVYIDTTLMGSVDNVSENIENDLPLYLFGCNKLNALSTMDSMIGRIYRATITEGEEVVMDLIPCLDDKGKPCMYDLISNSQTPFYNANAEGDDFRYVVKGKIPSWYKRVKYLESNGSQYIDTGYIPNNKTGLYLKAYRINGGNLVPFGARTNNIRFYPPRFNMNSISIEYGWGNYYSIGNRNTNDDLSYESWLNFYNSRKTSIQTQSKFYETNLSTTLPTISHTIYIFDWNYNGSPTTHWAGKIYRAKISQGIEIVRDFVPTLDENGIPCMFDLVEGIPYYNIGSGEFLYNKNTYEGSYTGFGQLSVMGNRLGGGTDGLPPAYTRVNYLESTGTQYIDTGIVTDGNYTICAKMNLSWNSAWGRAYKTSDYDNGGCSFCRRITTSGYYCLNFLYYWSGGIYPNRPNFTDVEWDFNEANAFEAKEGTTSVLINGKKSNIHGFSEVKVDASNPNNLSHYVFWANGVFSNGNGKGVMKLYNFSIKDDSEKIVLDFIPCLDDNGRPCMFDRVSRRSFYNSGTGEFLYG